MYHFGRSLNVANTHSDVIDSFELHASLDRIYRIAQVEAIKPCEDASHPKSTSCKI